jgi:hypothetical protein
MSVKTEDTKPLVSVDGHDVFNIPVEEEELDVAPSHGQSKIWAMKVLPIRLSISLSPADSRFPASFSNAGSVSRRRVCIWGA